MAARKKNRPGGAKKATRKTRTGKTTPRKVAGSKTAKARKRTAAKPKQRAAGKASATAGDVVYSDLRKIALARALTRR
jgi:hypothetical protein